MSNIRSYSISAKRYCHNCTRHETDYNKIVKSQETTQLFVKNSLMAVKNEFERTGIRTQENFTILQKSLRMIVANVEKRWQQEVVELRQKIANGDERIDALESCEKAAPNGHAGIQKSSSPRRDRKRTLKQTSPKSKGAPSKHGMQLRRNRR